MGGISEGYGRVNFHPSHPKTPANKGVSEENGRDERISAHKCMFCAFPSILELIFQKFAKSLTFINPIYYSPIYIFSIFANNSWYMKQNKEIIFINHSINN